MSEAVAQTSPVSPNGRGAGAFSFYEWMLARRYLGATRNGKGISLITIIAFGGIMLAVAVLIVVMAVMQGFRAKLLEQFLGLNGHVYVESFEPITTYETLADQLSNIPGVTNAAPVIQLPVYISSERAETGAVVVGIRKDDLLQREVLQDPGVLHSGTFESFVSREGEPDNIVIGTQLAYQLGVRAGDYIQLLTGRGAETPFGRTPRRKDYRVGAVYSVDNTEFDGLIIFMPLDQAQLFFNYPDTVRKIELRVAEPDRLAPILPAIFDIAGPLQVRDWRQVNASLHNALNIERGMVRIILSLIVTVAALNIVTGLIMLVKDKTRDIAVLRTMGATQGGIMRVFFISGSLIGVLGTIAGLILGTLFVMNIGPIEKGLSEILGIRLFHPDIYFFQEVPARVQITETIFVVGWTLAMSFISTLYPAWRAARLDPVEALRYE